ncbi:MAG: DNA mismatch repair endonuclease MutL [Phycisphaerae bacterium]
MPRIRKLQSALVNRIAAGEVVERPASVVKELIENAIDAGATRIDIAIENGGTRLIRVTDDGRGMDSEDVSLAVAPHATSKLATADDLFRVRTLGFRGEALASIAAVSVLTLRSRPPDGSEGYELTVCERTCDGGVQAGSQSAVDRPLASETSAPSPCPAPVGTTVEVRNLFYNVPARRKFLRQASTEHGHITEQLARLSLAHPQIAFTASHNGRSTRNLPPTADRRTRIADYYGPELADCLMHVDRPERDLRIEALIAPPAQSRTSTKWQYLFLNGRYIADRRIGFAIREAYRGLVENGRFPVVFIFLMTDPDRYDVNVHPTKIEVRWQDAGLVQSQVLAVLRETLLGHDLTPRLRTPVGDATATTNADAAHQLGARRALADFLKSVDPTQARIRFEPHRPASYNVRPTLLSSYADVGVPAVGGSRGPRPSDRGNEREPAAAAADASVEAAAGAKSGDPGPTLVHQSTDRSIAESLDTSVSVRPAIQIHNTYLVAQTDSGILIIDQHALHERILYEKFRRRILTGPLESQRLLMPQALNVSPEQARAVEQNRSVLARLGIEIEPFGPGSVAVQAFPCLLTNVDIEPFVRDLLDRLVDTDGSETDETILHRTLDMMACKAAVKAGDSLTSEEVQALLAQRHLVEKASNCPHGRPTTLQLTTHDLERQFKRI